eukprot:TRINITY_DN25348_c0_g1_i2.p1 TRINITY_DN25348_c0_g1~~TRINITY_DN25348_c0_g1_i2.p1  ORF type:complete len:212 (-),score=31.96 TRINITY_DN25348_c0_g1_i2:417-1052(-)
MCIRDSLQADLSDELRVVRGELENSEKLRGDTEKAMECAQVEQAQLVQSLESALREAQEEHRQARAENAQLLEQSRRFQIQLQSAQEEATRFAAERSMARGSPSQMDGSDSLSMSSSSPVQLHACLPQPSPSPTSIDPEVKWILSVLRRVRVRGWECLVRVRVSAGPGGWQASRASARVSQASRASSRVRHVPHAPGVAPVSHTNEPVSSP